MARVETLYQGVHPVTGEYYTFSSLGERGQELDMPFSRRTSTAKAPGFNGEIDLLGSRPAPSNKRQCSCSFVVPYDGSFVTAAGVPITNYTDAYDELIRQCGHGRPMKLIKKTGQSPPQFRSTTARIYDIPDQIDDKDAGAAYFTIHFEMTKPRWLGDPAGWHLWDDPAVSWDDPTIFWDDNPDNFALTIQATAHAFTNPGSLEAEEVRWEIHGPMPGPIQVVNQNVFVRPGQPMYWQWNEALLSGDVLVVDSGLGTVTKNGVNAFDGRFVVPLGQSKWFWMVTGLNNLAVISYGSGTYNGRAIVTADPPYA